MGLLRRLVSRLLRRERRAFTRATEATRTSRRLRDQVSFEIRYRDHRVIERCRDVNDPVRHILLLFFSEDFLLSASFCHIFVLCILCFVLCGSLRVSFNYKVLSTKL